MIRFFGRPEYLFHEPPDDRRAKVVTAGRSVI
jgi:hypothetical protein